MLLGWIAIVAITAIVRGFFILAEPTMFSSDTFEKARVFYNPVFALAYWIAERSIRIGGSFMISIGLLGRGSNGYDYIIIGLCFGVIAFFVSPFISNMVGARFFNSLKP